jgi:hypothetical protein
VFVKTASAFSAGRCFERSESRLATTSTRGTAPRRSARILEEIDQEARAAFLAAGGKAFSYIPCLNDRHEWIAALRDITLRHLQGWDSAAQNSESAAKLTRERALALGATD